jgi:hypothetical protein
VIYWDLFFQNTIMTLIEREPTAPFDFSELTVILKNEIITNPDSDGLLATIRAVARLLGISHSSLVDNRKQKNGLPKGLLCKLQDWSPEECPESLKPILGFDYKVQPYNLTPTTTHKYLPELVVHCIINYYAYDARQPLLRAKQLSVLFGTLGVRAIFSSVKGVPLEAAKPLKFEEATSKSSPLPSSDFSTSSCIEQTLELLKRLEALELTKEQTISILTNTGLLGRSSCFSGLR